MARKVLEVLAPAMVARLFQVLRSPEYCHTPLAVASV